MASWIRSDRSVITDCFGLRHVTLILQERRQDNSYFSSLFANNPVFNTGLQVLQSAQASALRDPQFRSDYLQAQTGGDPGPFISRVSSAYANPTYSSAVYQRYGTSTADAVYSLLSGLEKTYAAQSTSRAGSSSSGGSNAAPSAMQAPLAAGITLLGATAFVLVMI